MDTSGPVDLGHDVWMVDTRMGGYDGITASYLIRGSRPCLVETGTAPPFTDLEQDTYVADYAALDAAAG